MLRLRSDLARPGPCRSSLDAGQPPVDLDLLLGGRQRVAVAAEGGQPDDRPLSDSARFGSWAAGSASASRRQARIASAVASADSSRRPASHSRVPRSVRTVARPASWLSGSAAASCR